jgi:hypothetical protein
MKKRRDPEREEAASVHRKMADHQPPPPEPQRSQTQDPEISDPRSGRI